MKKMVLVLAIVFVILTCIFVFTAKTRPVSIQDNGKNLVWFEDSWPDESIAQIQKWIDEHPNKKILAVSSLYSPKRGWLLIYENR